MHDELLTLIHRLNPWLKEPKALQELVLASYIPRNQSHYLTLPDWDNLWLVLVGPRQAGKTTLGKWVAHEVLLQKRFETLLYLNCDFLDIRNWLRSPSFMTDVFTMLELKNPILFIDEVQRLENPGLLLKGIIDLQLPIKLMTSGSSQLEIKSTVQEYLTGRHLEALILPLSYSEMQNITETELIYGCYPAIVKTAQKQVLLRQLYSDYIQKDLIEILKVGKPDAIQKLIALIANSSGQLVNYNQWATDCKVSTPTIQHYCDLLENTYTIRCLKPFVGNKRQEITSNPIYYFIDNGFRNQALRRFDALDKREDTGLLVQNAVFQEIFKYQTQKFYDFDIHYWRTKSGAEVDFILHWNAEKVIPVEVKYQNLKAATISRGMRSFLEAYKPPVAFILTKNYTANLLCEGCMVYFIPFLSIHTLFEKLSG